MAAPPASPGPRGRFEQEQDRAVRALVRRVTGLPEEELGGERFQAALNFAWSNLRSAGAWRVPVLPRGVGRESAGGGGRVSATDSMTASLSPLYLGLLGVFSSLLKGAFQRVHLAAQNFVGGRYMMVV